MRFALFLLVAAGCGAEPPAPPPAPAPPAVEPAPPAPAHGALAEHMTEHLGKLTTARDALIKGDVVGAQAPLAWLAEHEPPEGLPENWRSYVERMRATARSAADAKSPGEVGRRIAAVASTCGECHDDNGVEVDFESVPAPEATAGVTAHMQRHAWAADQMWQGLIGPDPEGWARAATVLSESPFPDAPEAKLMTPEARMIATEMYQAGVQTLTAGTKTERLQLYGDFLGGCGTCHLKTSGGPK